MEVNLGSIKEPKKNLDDTIRTINLYFETCMNKALDAVRSTSKAGDTLASRKEYYKAKKLLEKLNSYTNDLLLDMKQANLLSIEIITVPFLPEIDDELQMQYEMVLLHGSSPWNFWLGHTQKDTDKKLNNLLKERLTTDLQKLDESPNPGDYVLCKRIDKFARGFVLLRKNDSSDHSERYHILDIDRGVIIIAKSKRLFKMDAEISLIPQQALKCTLIKDSKDSLLWTKELKELFLNSIRPCKLTVRIIGYNEEYPPHFQVELKAQNIEKDTGNTVDVGKWVTDRINPALKSGRSLSPVLDMFSIQDDKEDNSSKPLSQKSQASPTIEPTHNIREVEFITDENRLEQSPEIDVVSTPPATMIKVPTTAVNSNEYPRRDDDTVIQTTNVMSVNNPASPLLQNIHLMNLMTGYPSIPVLPNGMPFVGYPFNMNCLFPPPPNQASGYPAANQSLGSAISRFTTDLPPPPIQASGYPAANQSLGSAISRFTTDLPPPPIQASGYTAANQSLGSAISRFTTDLPPPPIQASGYPAANQSLGSAISRFTTDLPPPPIQASGYTAANQSLGSAISRSTTDLPPPPNQASGYPAANQSLGSAISRSTTDLPPPPNQASGYTAANQSLVSANSRLSYALPPPPNQASGYTAANQSLGSANLRSTTDFKPNQAVKPNKEWNPTSNNYFAETNRLDHVNENTLMATSGCIPMDEERICSFYRETGRCPKLGCRQIHKFMGKDVSAVVNTETYTRRKLPGEGRIIKIKVQHNGCLSPTRFYGHWEFINDAEKNRKIVRRSYVTYMHVDYESVEYSGGEDDEGESCKETLHTLMTALNEPYNIHHYQHLNVLPLIGELVIAKTISKVGRFVWLRAKVREVQRFGEKSCDVFRIDFGETDRIPLSDLRRMEPRFLRLPPQATQFCIAGVEELKEQWGPNEPPTSVISQLGNKTLYGKITKRHDDYVEVDLKDENGQSIRHKLHQTGKYRLVAIDVDSQKTG
ncbi:uncharacterized protein LOC111046061 isoform X2 [Nilaparvata lugens]|uniref:uncharacterized protein LOC111046061 isoform X2 n=1 Tax=Nilaparvata lugens TaxID=108931 RepID=UPI00193EB214|nr:uncharacterized protein LOC111046061 isoform X2 [Nilaparvata lugens]